MIGRGVWGGLRGVRQKSKVMSMISPAYPKWVDFVDVFWENAESNFSKRRQEIFKSLPWRKDKLIGRLNFSYSKTLNMRRKKITKKIIALEKNSIWKKVWTQRFPETWKEWFRKEQGEKKADWKKRSCV